MEHWDRLVKGLAVVGGFIAGFFGEWNTLLTVLVAAMCIDYLSGLIVAWVGKSLKSEGGGVSSEIGFRGLAKKAFIIFVVLLATLLDRALGTDGMIFQTAAVCYYIANEGISILENTALMGVPYPKKVKDALEAMKAKEDGENGE